ncbi:MAG: hypothetical protein KDJ52_34675 [Anaerolineae bacterium]|nr:hypothetical protein [Anaerolineae bacterium]
MADDTKNSFYASSSDAGSVPEIDPFKFRKVMEEIHASQNLPLGFIGGLVAAVIGAVIWAAITVMTGYQLGIVAVGLGFLVGVAVGVFGKGIDRIFGFMGAGLALFSCILGNFLTIAAFIAQEEAMSIVGVLFILFLSPSLVIELMGATFSPMDLLFYGIAVYEGYKFSFRKLTEADLKNMLKQSL